MDELSDLELLDALGVEITPEKQSARTPREERIIAGFEEIQRFYDEHGRGPLHGEDRDIFERLYAVRLDRLRELEECRTLLEPLDHQGLLNAEVPEVTEAIAEDVEDAELLAMLGVEAEASDITQLRHVRSSVEKRAAEEVASRQPCADFVRFKPLFAQVQQDLDTGVRSARPFGMKPRSSRGASSSWADRRSMSPRWARYSCRSTGIAMRGCASSSTTEPRATCSCAPCSGP